MSRTRRARTAVTATALTLAVAGAWLSAGPLGPATGQEQPAPGEGAGRQARRLAGPTRVETAVEVSRRQFPDGAREVYLANAAAPADALAGGALTGGPILLVPGCGPLPAAVAAEVERLRPAVVTALGGTAALAPEILQQATVGEVDPGARCPAGTPGAPQDVVRLDVAQGAEPGGPVVDVRVVNGTAGTVEYGLAYTLERFTGGGYEDVLDPEVPFASIGLHTDPGGVGEPQRLSPIVYTGGPRDGEREYLPPGDYRVTKQVRDGSADRVVSAYFTVAVPPSVQAVVATLGVLPALRDLRDTSSPTVVALYADGLAVARVPTPDPAYAAASLSPGEVDDLRAELRASGVLALPGEVEPLPGDCVTIDGGLSIVRIDDGGGVTEVRAANVLGDCERYPPELELAVQALRDLRDRVLGEGRPWVPDSSHPLPSFPFPRGQ